MTKVSIITPLYNGSKFITETINSVINQAYTDWEMIVINDCSPDNSEEIVKQFQKDYPQITLMKNSQNLWIVGSRNFWLQSAKGKYICFLDQDDVIEPTKLEKQILFLEQNPEYWMVWSAVVLINQNWDEINKIITKTTDIEIRNHIILSNQFACWAVMFRKDLLDTVWLLKKEYDKSDDYDLWLKIGKISKFYNLPDFLFKYRIHENNTTNFWWNTTKMKFTSLKLVFLHWYNYPNYIFWILVNIIYIIIPWSLLEKVMKFIKK